ncbi:hypothetical protein BC940DRAFT_64864 [Gongronella butleri]|nr:hypothetical protein BC940DRAFT_64864 [Gongronella butleri]
MIGVSSSLKKKKGQRARAYERSCTHLSRFILYALPASLPLFHALSSFAPKVFCRLIDLHVTCFFHHHPFPSSALHLDANRLLDRHPASSPSPPLFFLIYALIVCFPMPFFSLLLL